MKQPEHNFFATTARGLEPIIVDELQQFAVKIAKPTGGGVSFTAPFNTAYQMCLWSRVANRILFPLKTFNAENAQQFYQEITTIDWIQHFDYHNSIAVDFVGKNTFIQNTLFGAQKTKDAIVDYFSKKTGQRPSVDIQCPDIRLSVYMKSNQVTISIDLSGHSLHQRGYRQHQVKAPVKENIAAAILLRAGWEKIAAEGGSLVDPMCGSGTLLIEAALIAADYAPGLFRTDFGFNHWKQHDQDAWSRLCEQARKRAEAGLKKLPKIVGYDRDPRAIKSAHLNIGNAGLSDYIDIRQQALDQLSRPSDSSTGLICTNPPYGERLSDKNMLPPLYEELGCKFKTQFSGWNASVLTNDADLGKLLAIRTHRIHTIYNGPIECKLLHFKIEPKWFFREPYQLVPDPDALHNPDAIALKNRLLKNIKRLKRWAEKEKISCYRIYDADLPNYNLAVDLYYSEELHVNLQEYQAPKTIAPAVAKQRLREAFTIVAHVLQIPQEKVYVKVRQRQKKQMQYEKLADDKDFHTITEGSCKLLVNFKDYLDTGLFLDHRDTRLKIHKMAKNKRFLNLFCYTGAATIHAAKGEASHTCSVDMSKTYIQWAQRNLALNNLPRQKHELIQADCFDWLHKASATRAQYDLIFLDPPTFSNSKRMQNVLDIQRDHTGLIQTCMQLLSPDGLLIFSTNFRKFKLSQHIVLQFNTQQAGDSIPYDFQRNSKIHQCWYITHKQAA